MNVCLNFLTIYLNVVWVLINRCQYLVEQLTRCIKLGYNSYAPVCSVGHDAGDYFLRVYTRWRPGALPTAQDIAISPLTAIHSLLLTLLACYSVGFMKIIWISPVIWLLLSVFYKNTTWPSPGMDSTKILLGSHLWRVVFWVLRKYKFNSPKIRINFTLVRETLIIYDMPVQDVVFVLCHEIQHLQYGVYWQKVARCIDHNASADSIWKTWKTK